MNTLFRSTGTRSAAKRISTGMVVVKPTRRVGSVPDEDEVDEDDPDHDRPADEQHHVPVDDDIGRSPPLVYRCTVIVAPTANRRGERISSGTGRQDEDDAVPNRTRGSAAISATLLLVKKSRI